MIASPCSRERLKGLRFASVLTLILVLSAVNAIYSRAADSVPADFGPGSGAWTSYYNNPTNQLNWPAFCKDGGATLVTSANGVPACGPTPASGGVRIMLPGGVGPVVGFQCIELVERYLYVKYGWLPIAATNGAEAVKKYAAARHLGIIIDGTKDSSPEVGDIISFSNTKGFSDIGHTAVVTASNVDSSGKGYVVIVGENQNTVKGTYHGYTAGSVKMAVSDWKITAFDGDRYIEWLDNASVAPKIDWNASEAPIPRNADGARLWSVACPAASVCVAAGTYDTPEGRDRPLLDTWSGGSWKAVTPPLPAGAATGWQPDLQLYAVACGSISSCVVVGGYDDSSGHPQAVLLSGHGSSWTAVKAPLPAGGGHSVPAFGAACLAAFKCAAIADYTAPSGHSQGLVLTGYGSSWTGIRTPIPDRGSSSQDVYLFSIACSPGAKYLVSGYYNDSSGRRQGLLVSGYGPSWSALKTPLPAGAARDPGAVVTSVACSAFARCVAIGEYSDSSSHHQGLLLTGYGPSWRAVRAPIPPGAARDPSVDLSSVTCPTANKCVVMGAI